MTEDEMILAAMNDPDARPMSEAMLSVSDAQRRLERSRHYRIAASKALSRTMSETHDHQPLEGSASVAKTGGSVDAIRKDDVIATLKAAESELRNRGVVHIALFGSVARGEQSPTSDIDIMLDIDPEARVGVYEYVAIIIFLEDMFPYRIDVSDREALRPHVRPSADRDAIYAF